MHPTDLLTIEQRAVLRNLGGWMIADALIEPDRGCAALRTCMWGGTYNHGGEHAFFECTKRGIVVYGYTTPHVSTQAEDVANVATLEQALGRTELLLVRWSQLARYAASLPTSVREQLRRARSQLQAAWVAVCGPSPAPGRRPTGRDPAEATQLCAAHRAAGEVLTQALATALPLVEAAQQLDLFEMSP